MADTTFVDGVISQANRIVAAWLNDVNNLVYRDIINVKTSTYGAKGDGTTNDKAAIIAAYAASSRVFFPAGTYNMGNVSLAELMVTINGAGGPAALLTGGPVKFICTTTDSTIPFFFNVIDTKGFSVGDVKFQDSGYNDAIDWKGAGAFRLTSGSGKPVYNTTINSIYCQDMVFAVSCQGTTSAGNRVEGVKIGLMYCDHCYYGFNAQDTGDGVTIDMLVASRIKRSYFVYGVKQHRVTIYSKDPQQSSGDVQIAYDKSTSIDTADIHVSYCGRDTTNTNSTMIGLEFIGANGGSKVMKNIQLDVDIESSITTASPILIRDYDAAGVENTGASGNYVDRLQLNGRVVAAGVTNLFNINFQPTTNGQLQLGTGITRDSISANVTTYFNYGDTGLFNLTPAGWTDATAVSCGYSIKDNVVTLSIGSKTGVSNATSKTYSTVPAYLRPLSTTQFMPVRAQDNTGTFAWGLASLATSGVITLYPTAAAGNWTAANTAELSQFTISYALRP